MESTRGLKKFVKSKTFVLLILVILTWALFSILSEGTFTTLTNIRSILNSIVITIFLTIGAVYLMIDGHIDLSTSMVGSMTSLMVAIFISKYGLPWPVAIPLCLAVAGVIGFANAVLINEFRFQPFIATMAMASVVQGLTYVFCGTTPIPIKDPTMVALGTSRIGGLVPYTIPLALVALIIYGIILSKTNFGKSIYMIGGNPRAARLAGLNPKKMSYKLFINNAVLGGFAGCLLAFRLTSGTVDAVTNSQFLGMTGAILGGVSFGGGSGGMGGAFVGMLLLNGFSNGLTVLGLPVYWRTFGNGALLLFALTFDFIGKRRQMKT